MSRPRAGWNLPGHLCKTDKVSKHLMNGIIHEVPETEPERCLPIYDVSGRATFLDGRILSKNQIFGSKFE